MYLIILITEDNHTDIAPHLATLRGSVFGDPHVTIQDVNEVKFCYDLNSAGSSIQLFYFSNSDAPGKLIISKKRIFYVIFFHCKSINQLNYSSFVTGLFLPLA